MGAAVTMTCIDRTPPELRILAAKTRDVARSRRLLAVDSMHSPVGLPLRVLADTGYASGRAVEVLQAKGVETVAAIGRTQPHRPYDFRPPPPSMTPRRMTQPWRIDMKAKLETENGKALYKKRKQTVEPVFGIIKSAIGFRRFSLRGIGKAATEWTLIALTYNCRRMVTLEAA